MTTGAWTRPRQGPAASGPQCRRTREPPRSLRADPLRRIRAPPRSRPTTAVSIACASSPTACLVSSLAHTSFRAMTVSFVEPAPPCRDPAGERLSARTIDRPCPVAIRANSRPRGPAPPRSASESVDVSRTAPARAVAASYRHRGSSRRTHTAVTPSPARARPAASPRPSSPSLSCSEMLYVYARSEISS